MNFVVVIDGGPGAYGLWVPDMPGCTSMGKTVADVLRSTQEAVRMWTKGEPVPAPRSFEEIVRDPEVAEALKEGAFLDQFSWRVAA